MNTAYQDFVFDWNPIKLFKMAAPTTPTSKKDKTNESFLEKIGTMARKKKTKDDEEAVQYLNEPSSPSYDPTSLDPEGLLMDDNDERQIVEPFSRDDRKVQELIKVLLDWVNDVLADQRIIVKDVEEDFFDGQVLQKLIEKIANTKVAAPEVTQTAIGQKQKLADVLAAINQILNVPVNWQNKKWSVDAIHGKNLLAILHLLVALARHFRAPIRLPDNVSLLVKVVQKKDGVLMTKKILEEITTDHEDTSMVYERDAFDTLFDHAQDKLNVVKKSLITFVNKQLNKINLEVTDLDKQFHDGVYLCLLMGLLEGYFVPLYDFHLTPTTFEQKVHNVNFAFDLMIDAGLPRPKARAEDVVNQDLKSTLRVLYNLFTKYRAGA